MTRFVGWDGGVQQIPFRNDRKKGKGKGEGNGYGYGKGRGKGEGYGYGKGKGKRGSFRCGALRSG